MSSAHSSLSKGYFAGVPALAPTLPFLVCAWSELRATAAGRAWAEGPRPDCANKLFL